MVLFKAALRGTQFIPQQQEPSKRQPSSDIKIILDMGSKGVKGKKWQFVKFVIRVVNLEITLAIQKGEPEPDGIQIFRKLPWKLTVLLRRPTFAHVVYEHNTNQL